MGGRTRVRVRVVFSTHLYGYYEVIPFKVIPENHVDDVEIPITCKGRKTGLNLVLTMERPTVSKRR